MKNLKIKPLLIALVSALLLINAAQASIPLHYGLGSRTQGLGGTDVMDQSAFSAFSNPAGLPLAGDKSLEVSFGTVFMKPQFKAADGIVVENEFVSDKVRIGYQDPTPMQVLGTSFGARARLSRKWMNLTAGVAGYAPLEHIAYIDTGDPYSLHYPLYGSRLQRPDVSLGVGLEPMPWFRIGLGVRVAFALTGKSFFYLQTLAGKPSSARIVTSLKPQLLPHFGLQLEDPTGYWPGAQLSAVVRFPGKTNLSLDAEAGARIFNNAGAFDLSFNSQSAVYDDPLTWELGLTLPHFRYSSLRLQANYELWKDTKDSALTVAGTDTKLCQIGAICPFVVSGSQNLNPERKNLWVFRVGEEIAWNAHSALRLGYSYRPSLYQYLPTEAGNSLDPASHAGTFGVGFKWDHFLDHADLPWGLDLHASFQQFETQSIQKTPGDESGTLPYSKIGAPGYTAGGFFWGTGITLAWMF